MTFFFEYMYINLITICTMVLSYKGPSFILNSIFTSFKSPSPHSFSTKCLTSGFTNPKGDGENDSPYGESPTAPSGGFPAVPSGSSTVTAPSGSSSITRAALSKAQRAIKESRIEIQADRDAMKTVDKAIELHKKLEDKELNTTMKEIKKHYSSFFEDNSELEGLEQLREYLKDEYASRWAVYARLCRKHSEMLMAFDKENPGVLRKRPLNAQGSSVEASTEGPSTEGPSMGGPSMGGPSMGGPSSGGLSTGRPFVGGSYTGPPSLGGPSTLRSPLGPSPLGRSRLGPSPLSRPSVESSPLGSSPLDRPSTGIPSTKGSTGSLANKDSRPSGENTHFLPLFPMIVNYHSLSYIYNKMVYIVKLLLPLWGIILSSDILPIAIPTFTIFFELAIQRLLLLWFFFRLYKKYVFYKKLFTYIKKFLNKTRYLDAWVFLILILVIVILQWYIGISFSIDILLCS